MDRHGLLNICHKVNRTFHDTQVKHITEPYQWKWDCTAVVYPESRCYYCRATIRSPLVWLLKGENQTQLLGQLYFEPGRKVKLLHIPHVHMISSVTLCLGNTKNGVDLLSSTIYPGGVSISLVYIPRWYKRYWNHDCPQMREYITKSSNEAGRPSQGLTLIKELDTPWSMSSVWEE